MAYPGGKDADGVYQRIINQIPPHDVYVEPFLGGAAIMRRKRPAAASIAIDVDGDVVAAFNASGGVPGCTVIYGDAISWLREHVHGLTARTFVYLDPPYLFDVRFSKDRIYRHEFGTMEQHIELLGIVRAAPCMVAISGYWSDLYGDMLAGWRSIKYQVGVRGGFAATEWLWMNYPEPMELHDYRYLGENFREREKINRQRRRWRARLARMDRLQRLAVLASIAEMSELA